MVGVFFFKLEKSENFINIHEKRSPEWQVQVFYFSKLMDANKVQV